MSAKSGQSCNSEPIGIRQDGLINGLWSLKNQLTEKASVCGRVFTVSIPDVPDSGQNWVSTFKICRRKPCIVY